MPMNIIEYTAIVRCRAAGRAPSPESAYSTTPSASSSKIPPAPAVSPRENTIAKMRTGSGRPKARARIATHRPSPLQPRARCQTSARPPARQARGAHQRAKRPRVPMQDSRGKDRHQDGIGHRHQAHKAKQKQRARSAPCRRTKRNPSAMCSNGETRGASTGARSNRIISKPAITAM